MAALTRERPAPVSCGRDGTVLRYSGGLSLMFRARSFTGWRVDGPPGAYSTAQGLIAGAAPAAAEGLVIGPGPDGRTISLQAGSPCAAA